MPTFEIDGKPITVEDGVNLVQAAERLGIEIPHYCYHPGLSVAGSCRMCLVEIKTMPKLQIACNTQATEGMVVWTQSERVRHAREAVLEFLLINHPIDCPICDQAGECKLQDYYMDHDRQASRFPVQDKVRKGKAIEIGPLVMLDQERCILCSRCIRFLDEVTKTSELGIFERGDHSMIDLFPGRRLDNPYSGNVVDVCPVGALTNKDFRFRARVWYLDSTPSVCPSCATGCNVDIYHRRGEMYRFRPRYNAAVNEYWMCDEGRLSYKRFQGEGRLLQPVRRDGDGWAVHGWEDAVGWVVQRLREIDDAHGPQAIGGVVSAQATNEELFLFSRLLRRGLRGRVAGMSWSPPEAFHDDLLIDADKNPNSAGFHALGLGAEGTDARGMLADARAGKIRALVLLRTNLGPGQDERLIEELGKQVELMVVLDTHYHLTAEIADVLLPVATFAETDGTFINRRGRVQRIREAFRPPGQARQAWLVLSQMLARADGGPMPADASAVFSELAASVPGFGHLSYRAVGNLGTPLEAPAGA